MRILSASLFHTKNCIANLSEFEVFNKILEVRLISEVIASRVKLVDIAFFDPCQGTNISAESVLRGQTLVLIKMVH